MLKSFIILQKSMLCVSVLDSMPHLLFFSHFWLFYTTKPHEPSYKELFLTVPIKWTNTRTTKSMKLFLLFCSFIALHSRSYITEFGQLPSSLCSLIILHYINSLCLGTSRKLINLQHVLTWTEWEPRSVAAILQCTQQKWSFLQLCIFSFTLKKTFPTRYQSI